MKFISTLLFVFVLSFSAIASETQLLRIHGSNTVGANLAPEIARSWLQHKGYSITSDKMTAKEERLIKSSKNGKQLNIEIHAHGSSTSFKDFANGATDVGMSSRNVKAKEVKKLSALGDFSDRQSEYVIALDGLPIIVHKSNPLKSLSKETIKKIFAGEIKYWSELGLKRGRINVYARDNNSGTYDTFKSLVLGKKVPLAIGAKRFESNAELSDTVASDPDGIGFVGLAYIRNAKVLSVSDAETIALKPDEFTVATEDYVLARRLYLYIPQKNSHPLAKEFADYAVSSAADAIVKQVGFVSQEIQHYRVKLPEKVPSEYRVLTTGAYRLSLNVRFKSGSVKLDNKATRDINRLVEFFSKPENKHRKLMLFGFADKHEVIPYISNSFSVQRADIVADYLARHGVHAIKVRGYGQELPVATNETKSGQYKNRRVEIWVL